MATNHNIALLPLEERNQIALEKYAAMLVKKMKLGLITRSFIESEVKREPSKEKRVKIKSALNKYRVK